MTLRDQLENDGSWLFRHRSYLPLAVIPIFVACLSSFTYLRGSHALNEWWQILCLAISFSGLGLRILVIGRAPLGTSGRNTREQVASTLTTTGIYSVIRHPLYLGNYLIFVGIALWPHSWWLVILTSAVYALYYERIIMAEEAFLREKFGKAFEAWARTTPVFIPKVRAWKPSPISFSWQTVAQREYNAFFLILAIFFLFDTVGDSIAEKRVHMDEGWFCVLVLGFVIFATLRCLKKRTRLLNVEGR